MFKASSSISADHLYKVTEKFKDLIDLRLRSQNLIKIVSLSDIHIKFLTESLPLQVMNLFVQQESDVTDFA